MVTAAHCVDGFDARMYEIVLGELDHGKFCLFLQSQLPIGPKFAFCLYFEV